MAKKVLIPVGKDLVIPQRTNYIALHNKMTGSPILGEPGDRQKRKQEVQS